MQFPLTRYLLICIMRQQFVLHICIYIKFCAVHFTLFILILNIIFCTRIWTIEECIDFLDIRIKVLQHQQNNIGWLQSDWQEPPKYIPELTQYGGILRKRLMRKERWKSWSISAASDGCIFAYGVKETSRKVEQTDGQVNI